MPINYYLFFFTALIFKCTKKGKFHFKIFLHKIIFDTIFEVILDAHIVGKKGHSSFTRNKKIISRFGTLSSDSFLVFWMMLDSPLMRFSLGFKSWNAFLDDKGWVSQSFVSYSYTFLIEKDKTKEDGGNLLQIYI